MQRKIISGGVLMSRVFPLLYIAVGVALGIIDIYHFGLNGFELVMLAVIAGGSWAGWLGFKLVHPVYFDDTAFYFTKHGIAQTIPYSQVISFKALNYNQYGVALLRLTFTDIGKVKSIWFNPVEFVGQSEVIQCEKLMQIQQPGFRVTGSEKLLNGERQLDKARSYTGR